MSVLPTISNKNKLLQSHLDGNTLSDLPRILKNNVHKPKITLYDSGWEYYQQFSSGTGMYEKNEIGITSTTIEKLIALQLPESLIPYLDVNVIMENTIGIGGENTGYTGIAEDTRKTILTWILAYHNGELIFEGIPINYFSFAGTSSQSYYRKDNTGYAYTTLKYGLNAWTFNLSWSFGGQNYRMVDAEFIFDLPSNDKIGNVTYTVDGNSTYLMNGIRTDDHYGYPPADFTYDYLSGGSNYEKLTTYKAAEVVDLTPTTVTIRGTEVIGPIFSTTFEQRVNIEKTFSLATGSWRAKGLIEKEFEGNWYSYLDVPAAGNQTFNLNFAPSFGAATVTLSNPKIAGYYPCFDARKLIKLHFNYSGGAYTISKFVSTDVLTDPQLASSYAPVLGDIYVDGSVGPPQTLANADRGRKQVGTNTNSVFTVDLTFKLGIFSGVSSPPQFFDDTSYNRFNNTNLAGGNKKVLLFRNAGTDLYTLSLSADVVGFAPATQSLLNTNSLHTGIISGTFSLGSVLGDDPSGSNSDFLSVNTLFYDTGLGGAFAQGNYNTLTDNSSTVRTGLPFYRPPDTDVRAKVVIDIKNPFFSNTEHKIIKK